MADQFGRCWAACGVFSGFFGFWFLVSVFLVVVVKFYGFQYQLYISVGLYKFVASSFVFDGGANLYGMISSAMILLKSHFLSMSTSLFQYSSNVSLSSCFLLKNWALLWNTFLTGRKVFVNNINNSGRLTSFNSRPHWPLMISCLSFGPNAQMTLPFMWYAVCWSMYSIPSSITSSRYRLYVKWIYSDICSHHILRLIFERSVSLSDRIGIL